MAFCNYLLLGFVILAVTSSFARAETSADLTDADLAIFQSYFKNLKEIGRYTSENYKALCARGPKQTLKFCEALFENLTRGDVTLEITKQALQAVETVDGTFISRMIPQLRAYSEATKKST